MDDPARAEIVLVAGIEGEEGPARIVRLASPIHEGLVAADDLGGVAADEPGGPFVLRDPEQLRVPRYERVGEIRKALAGDDVLIDGDAPQESEAFLVAGRHDDRVPLAGAAQQIAGEDRRASRRATDDASAREDIVECLLRLRASVGIDEMPLAAALEPDPACLRDDRREAVAVRELPVDRVQDDDVLRARVLEGARSRPVGWVDAIAAGGGDVDDERIRSPGELDESSEH